jgi:hypothetical protein
MKDIKKFDFSITFWIVNEKNPGWNNKYSIINFPSFMVKEGIQVFFTKNERFINVYILHPEFGYRKISASITNYIGKDTFIALTNTENTTILYINAKLVAEIKKENLLASLESNDYVMVKVYNDELEGIKVGKNIDAIFPARIIYLNHKENTAKFEFFSVGNKAQIIELPIERIKY